MSEPRTHTGVLDRIEREREVGTILLEDDSGTVVEEVVLPLTELPETATEGSVLTVEIVDETVTAVTVDAETTAKRRDRLKERFDRLATRPEDEDS